MYDLKYLREHPEEIKRNNKRRGCTIDVDALIALDGQYRQLQASIEQRRAQRKSVSRQKPSAEEIAAMRTLGEEIERDEKRGEELLNRVNAQFSQLPNILAEDVPDGKDDSDNVVIKTVGEKPAFPFEPRDHIALGEALDIIDVKHAASVTGSRFYFLKNAGAQLRLALHQWGWQTLSSEGFTLMTTPHLAGERTLYGTGYLPFFAEDVWRLEGSSLALIGTSEQTLVAYHQDEFMSTKDLPKRYSATSECFRTEAGSYGKDTRGIFRVHEFWKMEQIILCTPESAEEYHQRALAVEEWFAQQLGIPYHVVLVCSGDCGAPGYKKFDLESWFPAQGRYRELTSNTNLTDFQTRRLNIRYKDADGAIRYPYSISATALTDRWILAIMENYQQADGSIRVPSVLVPFMGTDRIVSRS
ncbi:serine--tRNA ligase [Candidatus Uhrbacteria bacterium]|nr:serine--tRNA ligase [Candidatus Uhrbacteria bacterium]